MLRYSLKNWRHQVPATASDVESVRVELFEAKRVANEVSKVVPGHTFTYAQRSVNPYELIQHLDNDSPSMRPRSFYTVLELASMFPSIGSAACRKTLHLCEAPGFFCDAVLMLSNEATDWHACSLSNDGKLFQKHLLLAKKSNGHSRVVFGERGTGDLREKDTALCVVYECGGNVALVTADGCTDEAREHWNPCDTRLLAAQLFTALHSLAPKGCLVLRLDNVLHASNQDYVWACSRVFTEVHVVKLKSTAIHSSTVYVVGLGYQKGKRSQDLIKQLEKVAYSNEELDAGVVAEEQRLALSRALCQMAQMQSAGILDAANLAKYLYSTGVQTLADVRAHFSEHLSTNYHKTAQADAFLATIRANKFV